MDNMNWMIIDGLKRYGFKDHAAALRESTLELITKSGFYEYFDPVTGEPLGRQCSHGQLRLLLIFPTQVIILRQLSGY